MELRTNSLSEQLEYSFRTLNPAELLKKDVISAGSSLLTLSYEEFSKWWWALTSIFKAESGETIEDAFMDAVLKFLEKKQKEKNSVRDDRAYFYKIFRNGTIAMAIKRKQLISLESMKELDQTEETISVLNNLDLFQLLMHSSAFKKEGNYCLSIREVCTLFNFRIFDYSLKEIAGVLGKDDDTVKSYHFRAISEIKQFCKDTGILEHPERFDYN